MPNDTHHTAIGDWHMICCLISSVSERFVLSIHYEHLGQRINGSCLFLYDLNISQYLSPWSPTSEAYFSIRMDANALNLQVYTTKTDTVWNPINCTLTLDDEMRIASIQMYSEYIKTLLGNLEIFFSDAEISEFPVWVMPALLMVATLLTALGYKRLRRSAEKFKPFFSCQK